MPAAPLPPRDALISEEARTGNLELLLQKVSAADREAHLAFPAVLAVSPPPPAEPVIGPDGQPILEPTPAELAPTVLAAAVPKAGGGVLGTRGGPDPIGQAPTDGYALQVAVTDSAGARALVGQLAAKGVDAYSIDAVVDGQPEHRVRVGGFASSDAATAALPDLQAVVGGSLSVVKAP